MFSCFIHESPAMFVTGTVARLVPTVPKGLLWPGLEMLLVLFMSLLPG